jgi:hypothetical protein
MCLPASVRCSGAATTPVTALRTSHRNDHDVEDVERGSEAKMLGELGSPRRAGGLLFANSAGIHSASEAGFKPSFRIAYRSVGAGVGPRG